ncbi:isoaspartyl peptidase/L-asparaginase [Luteimonas yindakuii]|uniref:Isoaspartyl peptidase n=1 Tax=Luteimonas yindakuii TaxID=2565782 RepID=A0A4Z1R6Y2_9GAMM|nr:isoaspartyl peptidase/L-asparaginase [Luteimonas yindakuii]
MRPFLLCCVLLLLPMHVALAQTQPTALVIHGGAGVIERDSMSAGTEREIRAALDAALDAGHAVLARGGSALDAAEASVRVLEESPRFNAGKGAVFNAEGRHELDASVMEGHTRRAGAVAAVSTVRSPVRLARRVMEQSPHVMLIGDGAERFADDHPDLERVPNAWFDTPQRREQLERAQVNEAQRQAGHAVPAARDAYFGTVGAVALDRHGHIAAATSTGGMTNKRWGRVGDAPIIGAGTWADDRCGVSATGWGEFFIRNAVAHDICARVAYRGDSLADAAGHVIGEVIPAQGGDGGVIALDAQGNIALPFNTPGMYRGWIDADGRRGVAIFADE